MRLVQGVRFRVNDLGCVVWGAWFRVYGSGCKAGCMDWRVWFRGHGLECVV